MKRVLIVCYNYNTAKRRFRDMLQYNKSAVGRVSQARLTIELGDAEYEFISSDVSDRLMGRTFHTIHIDEMVQLTIEQSAMLMSRKR